MIKKLIIRLILFVLFTNIYFFSFSQTLIRKNVNFPDIPGYKTLKCDFHSHTFLSDGNPSPEYRVIEAWADGLDVIAITDHIDRHPKVKFNKKGKAELYKQAFSAAKKSGIVLVPGGELTKLKPIGHYNLLFIKSFRSVKRGNYMCVLKKAKKQSAFVLWNHPGWKKKDLIPNWFNAQTKIYKNGLMNGIEIVNGKKIYPLAFEWALEKNLTIIGNSDIHDSTKNRYRVIKGEHRPMTLVFARDTSLQSIKEALSDKRTVVYYQNALYGTEKHLASLFNASVKIPDKQIVIYKTSQSSMPAVLIVNNSCFDFQLKLAEKLNDLELPAEIVLKANSKNEFIINVKPDTPIGDRNYKCLYNVINLFKSSTESLQIEIPLDVRIF